MIKKGKGQEKKSNDVTAVVVNILRIESNESLLKQGNST